MQWPLNRRAGAGAGRVTGSDIHLRGRPSQWEARRVTTSQSEHRRSLNNCYLRPVCWDSSFSPNNIKHTASSGLRSMLYCSGKCHIFYMIPESQLDRDSPIFCGTLTTAQFLRLSSLFRLSLLKLTNIHPTPCLGSGEEKQMRWEQQQQSWEGDLRHLGTSGDFPVLCLQFLQVKLGETRLADPCLTLVHYMHPVLLTMAVTR